MSESEKDENEPIFVKQEKVRVICESCGEREATIMHCYINPKREKPASAWSSDYELPQCDECDRQDIEAGVPSGYKWNCSFKRNERFDHMFWDTKNTRVWNIIELSSAEVQSGLDRVKWAEGLIKQLPEDHDGRNSWLLNYGSEPAS